MIKQQEQYKNIIEEYLSDAVPAVSEHASVIRDAMEYSLLAGGKRLRPTLLLASCDFAGGNCEAALPYAFAIEAIHTYSLIHDDLPAMDNDDLRRGKPTNHVIYGEGMAVLAGDGLLNTAFEVMLKDAASETDDAMRLRKVKAAAVIAECAGINGMIGGQVADISEKGEEASAEMIEFIELKKTAALIKAPIIAGLTIGGADDDTINDFTEYGELLGVGFQIADDILDMTSDAETMGKKTQKDADEEKCNYAYVYGLETARDTLHALTEKAVSLLDKYGDDSSFFRELALKLETRNK
jgi:geranylgeranyl diphosphate synthase type II